jgi:cephalosporin hydroxylase
VELEFLDLSDIHQKLGIPILSGHRADFSPFQGKNAIFDSIAAHAGKFYQGYEDQCSNQYYFDLFQCVKKALGEITRIVEVGVYMGGASTILAGCAHIMGLELDLVDIDAACLRFTYERIRRTFPEQAAKVRLYHGDLPSYVRDVLLSDTRAKALVQHDGSHEFEQVVKDLSMLSFVKDRIHSITVQDTHLRGLPHAMQFVDAAVFAVFGYDAKFSAMGTAYAADNQLMTTPNRFQGNYFLPETYEGLCLAISENSFRYPHPSVPLEAFFREDR